jgi:hypothetical protein
VLSHQAGNLIDRERKLHRGIFEWCLDQTHVCLDRESDDDAARWLLFTARWADMFGCGQLTSTRLERLAITLAGRLGPRPLAKSSTGSAPLRWLHVMSIAYRVGGHTTMVRRWIENDNSGDEHNLVLTFMDELDLADLSATIRQSGGKVTTLGGVSTFLDRARQLRELAWRKADRVVVHCHMWDVIPTIAFGIAGGPPVLFLNHADHTFWVGASIADVVVNLRQSGQDLTINNRGIDRNFLFRIPLPDPAAPVDVARNRAETRAKLGIPTSAIVFLTVGAAYKYESFGKLDFLTMAQRLLAILPEAYLICVGPSSERPDWNRASNSWQPRLILLGAQYPVTPYHATADIYLEGFPFDSHTALLEAAVSGLPVVRIPASAMSPFSGHHFPLSVITQPDDVEMYLAQAISLATSQELRRSRATKLQNAVTGLQCGSAWDARLRELKQATPDQHVVYVSNPIDPAPEIDRFWTAFLKTTYPGDTLQKARELARQSQLNSGDLNMLLAEYLSRAEATQVSHGKLSTQPSAET